MITLGHPQGIPTDARILGKVPTAETILYCGDTFTIAAVITKVTNGCLRMWRSPNGWRNCRNCGEVLGYEVR